MRLAFFSNSNSIHLKEWSEYFVRELGHDVFVITIPKNQTRYEGAEVIDIGTPVSGRKIGWFTVLPGLRATLHRLAPDLLIAYRIKSYGFLATFTGFRPLAMAGQGGNLFWPPNSRLGEWCVRRAIQGGDLFNAWSPNIRDSMIRYGADPQKILLCSRGIDLSLFPSLPEKPAGPLRIVMTRSLLPSYNTIQLVEAMPEVLRNFPDAVCEIAGDGPLRAPLEARALALGLGRHLVFRGRIAREEIVRMLAAAHIYVSTTLTDGLPLSHFEAMASGAIPICTDIVANRIWIRSGENGHLVPVGDAAALAARIVETMRDERFRSAAALENRRLVEADFDRDVNMRRMEAAWRDLVARSGGRAGKRSAGS